MRTADITTKTIKAATIMIGTKRFRFRSISPPLSFQLCMLRAEAPGDTRSPSRPRLHDVDRRSHRDHVVFIKRARRPHLTGELDESLGTGDLFENHRFLSDQRVAALAYQWRMGHM